MIIDYIAATVMQDYNILT